MVFKKLFIIASILLVGTCNADTIKKYYIVVDAGSSGSRVYLYDKQTVNNKLVVNDLYEKKVDLPLASYIDNSQDAYKSIAPLLESAIIKLSQINSTVKLSDVNTNVLATAGMRLIPESNQSAIYKNVAEYITTRGLQLGQTKTITGQYEGIYSWTDVNYLTGGLDVGQTKGIFEVGGASAQITFTTKQTNSNTVKLSINGKNYNVYSVSYLGLGQNVARDTMDTNKNAIACYPSESKFSFNKCTNEYKKVLHKFNNKEIIKNTDFHSQQFIGISSVYYAYNFWHVESHPDLLESNIKSTCANSLDTLQKQYPNAYSLKNQCANSVFINTLANSYLDFKPEQLLVTEKINGVPLTWTLGYVLLQE